MPKLFGTNGVRGPAESLFTNHFCLQIGSTFGAWLKSKNLVGPVGIAFDPRESGPRIKEHVIHGLAVQGYSVIDFGVIPTPALTYFTKINSNLAGALMITGSHIAADLNGIKFLVRGEEVTKSEEAEIENVFSSQLPVSEEQVASVVNSNEAKESYIDMLVGLADLPYPDWKIVVDTANGTQSEIVRELFSRLGLTLSCTQDCDIQSPYFVPRDTEVQSTVSDLSKEVLVTKADLGIAFDADGDRVVFVDDAGRFVPGDYSCSLIAKYSQSDDIVTPISTSSVVDSLGKKVHRTKVGATHVIAKMKSVGATFGFEPNGGGISGEIFYGRDGGATVIKLFNLLKTKKTPLSDLVASLPSYFLYKDKLDCPFSKYEAVYESIKDKYQSHRFDETDGVKILLNDTDWLLFRGSGNAPEFRVFAQANDEKKARKLCLDGIAQVKSVIHLPSTIQPPGHVTIDSLNVLDSIKLFPKQLAQVLTDQGSFRIPTQCDLVDHIVVAGMGGSALGGRIISALEHDVARVPVIISTEYRLPSFVGPRSLVIACSYSGDTEETLSAANEALAKNAHLFIIASGGKLAALAQEKNLPHYIFDPVHNPSNQPRLGLGYSILSIICLLQRCGHITPLPDLGRLPGFLVTNQHIPAYQAIASQLVDKIPVLISAEHMTGVSHAVKNMFNENSKVFATSFDLPEANHHLLEGLMHPRTNSQNLCALFVNSAFYHPDLSATLQATKDVFKKNHIQIMELNLPAPSPIFESLYFLQTGAFISYYLAQAYSVDPGPIPYVHWYKDQL